MANRLLLLPRTGSAAVALSKATNTTTSITIANSNGGGSSSIVSSTLSPVASPLHQTSRRPFSSLVGSRIRSSSLNASAAHHHHQNTIHTMTSRNGKAQCSQSAEKLITVDNMNPNIIKMEYAVRGPLVIRAAEIERELKAVSCSVYVEIGNCTDVRNDVRYDASTSKATNKSSVIDTTTISQVGG